MPAIKKNMHVMVLRPLRLKNDKCFYCLYPFIFFIFPMYLVTVFILLFAMHVSSCCFAFLIFSLLVLLICYQLLQYVFGYCYVFSFLKSKTMDFDVMSLLVMKKIRDIPIEMMGCKTVKKLTLKD